MQISIETTTQSTSLMSASFQGSGNPSLKPENEDGKPGAAPKDTAVSLLEAASQKAEEDAVVIAALREAVEEGKGDEDDDEDGALATVEDYQKTAGQIAAALGEDAPGSTASLAYESATISTTTIEAEIGGETLTAQFVSFERVSYNSETGLSARSASASTIEGDFNNGSFSYQSASVSELYTGTGNQVSNLAGLTA